MLALWHAADTISTTQRGMITSILRFAAFIRIDDTTDPTWRSAKLAIYGVTEPSVYLIASCLPTYRTILRYLREILNGSHLLKSKEPSKKRIDRRARDGNANVQFDNLEKSTQKMGYGNKALVDGYTYDSDIAHLVDSLRFQDVLSSSSSLEAGIGSEEGIRMGNHFIVTSDSKGEEKMQIQLVSEGG